jgi:hypothetical protein
VMGTKYARSKSKYSANAAPSISFPAANTRITGNTFFMDLRLNRFVIAGNVRVFAAGKEIDGAAFAEYFDFDRAYFVPITTEPDRWTFVAGDYAHPALGRQMPGDTFFLPDLSGERVFLYANRAVVDPRESVRFAPAKLNFGLDTFVTFPSYFLTFSQNPNYAQNALPGAYIDGPLDFAGGENGLSAAHIRYDSLNGIFPALEQHLIGQNYYLVAAASPLTRPLKQYFAGLASAIPGSGDRLSEELSTATFGNGVRAAAGHGKPAPFISAASNRPILRESARTARAGYRRQPLLRRSFTRLDSVSSLRRDAVVGRLPA